MPQEATLSPMTPDSIQTVHSIVQGANYVQGKPGGSGGVYCTLSDSLSLYFSCEPFDEEYAFCFYFERNITYPMDSIPHTASGMYPLETQRKFSP